MNRCLLFLICFLFSITKFAQIAKTGEKNLEIPLIANKVVFLKEISIKSGFTQEANYNSICQWAKINYENDPFKSSLRYDVRNFEIIIKSRVEMLLPANLKGVREKMVLRYRINTFIFQDKCVIEITDLMYMYENTKSGNILPKTIKAEDFITDNQIKIQDNTVELKLNTRKSTLLFINEIMNSFEKHFAN